MYLAGTPWQRAGYRIPSIVAGIGTVVVAGLIGCRRGLTNAWIAMVLIGFSYVLNSIQIGQDLSFLVFFSFLSYYCLDTYLTTGRWLFAGLFAVSAILGFLSHLTFVTFSFSPRRLSGPRGEF